MYTKFIDTISHIAEKHGRDTLAEDHLWGLTLDYYQFISESKLRDTFDYCCHNGYISRITTCAPNPDSTLAEIDRIISADAKAHPDRTDEITASLFAIAIADGTLTIDQYNQTLKRLHKPAPKPKPAKPRRTTSNIKSTTPPPINHTIQNKPSSTPPRLGLNNRINALANGNSPLANLTNSDNNILQSTVRIVGQEITAVLLTAIGIIALIFSTMCYGMFLFNSVYLSMTMLFIAAIQLPFAFFTYLVIQRQWLSKVQQGFSSAILPIYIAFIINDLAAFLLYSYNVVSFLYSRHEMSYFFPDKPHGFSAIFIFLLIAIIATITYLSFGKKDNTNQTPAGQLKRPVTILTTAIIIILYAIIMPSMIF